eukprot:4950634-Amphidinium_carterae.1
MSKKHEPTDSYMIHTWNKLVPFLPYFSVPTRAVCYRAVYTTPILTVFNNSLTAVSENGAMVLNTSPKSEERT